MIDRQNYRLQEIVSMTCVIRLPDYVHVCFCWKQKNEGLTAKPVNYVTKTPHVIVKITRGIMADIICNFPDVVLFGSTSAKVELLNLLRADHQFEKKTFCPPGIN
jgi:hypothetical protein